MELEFEWDEDKAAANLAKHRVSFLTAAEVFANEILERIDDRERSRQGGGRGLPRGVYLAGRQTHPHHQRPESEQG